MSTVFSITRRGASRVVAASAVSVLVAASVVLFAEPAQSTVPGNPGVAQAATVVYQEDFQNLQVPTSVVRLTDYVAADGGRYTADVGWLTHCNGWIASSGQPVNSSAQVADCANEQSYWNLAQQLARAIGLYNGDSWEDSVDNFAVTAFTGADLGSDAVEFRTVANRAFTAGNGRFITFSADVAAVNCGYGVPKLQFQLIDDDGAITNAGSEVDACDGGTPIDVPDQIAPVEGPVTTVSVKTATSNGSVLFSGSSIGVRMLNNNASGTGNDHAFDNILIVDASPQLDQSFSPAAVVAGGTSALTLTVTNTDELAAKNGWSFTDALPSGLTVADGTASTTCPAGVVTAAQGSTSISVSGDLNYGMASCTVTVNVISPVAGSFTNAAASISSVGLNAPAASTVRFLQPAVASVVVEPPVSGSFQAIAGETLTFDGSAFDSQGNAHSSAVTYTTSLTGSAWPDVIVGDTIRFSIAGVRTVTATAGSISTSFQVVVSAAAPAEVALSASAASAIVGESITLRLLGTDAYGNATDDLTSQAVFTSDWTSDVIDGATVTFTHASVHTMTATLGSLTPSTAIQVSDPVGAAAAAKAAADAASALSATGANALPALITGGALLLVGLILMLILRRRRRA